jgi:hypothetical protein
VREEEEEEEEKIRFRDFAFLKNTCMFEFDLKAKLIGHNGQDAQIRVNYIDQQEKKTT